MKCDQDLCLNFWYDFKKLLWQDKLNSRVSCAFVNVFNSNRLPHGGGKRARMLAGDNEVVEEGEDEVEDQASPDCDVVEHCPIWGVQSHLGFN